MHDFLKRAIIPVLFMLHFTPATVFAAETAITGSGSQPVARLYTQWAEHYKARLGVPVTYKITNVVLGMQDLESKKADFAGMEIPQRSDELTKKGQFQFPTALVSFTPFVNIPGIHNNQLVLDANTLAGIFLGTIKTWNDPLISALNPGLNLPDAEIKTVHRNTGNTITYALSTYLTRTSSVWANTVGAGSKINWPVGYEVDTNENLIAYVRDTPNTIGFTMLSLVIKNRLNLVRVKNAAGNIVNVSPDSIKAAASNARWDAGDGFYNILINMPGANTWPFVMTGYITLRVPPEKDEAFKQLIDFCDSSLKTSELQAVIAELVPLPNDVISIVRKALKAQLVSQPATAAK